VSLDFSHVAAIDVGRHFGRRKALSHISFECHAGEIIGLLGPNGAGKSTLISILATLLAVSTGRVEYGGHSSTTAGAKLRARLGLLGHDLYLYPELTARENLVFFAKLYGLNEAESRAEQALRTANLAERGDDQVLGFSRGMRQRLALERALLHDPRLLLLDEPFTGLDQASAAALVSRLKGLQASGCLIIVATHDLDVVDGVLSRVLFLRNGRLINQDDQSLQLRERYRQVINAS
jgi:ABC-type multidrug transport system ATPase subunit